MATGVSRRARERYLESDKEDGPGHCCQDQGHRERIASQAVLPTLQGSRHGAVRKNCVKHTQPKGVVLMWQMSSAMPGSCQARSTI